MPNQICHCRRPTCACVVVKDDTRYAPSPPICGQPFAAGGYTLGCLRDAAHEGACAAPREEALLFDCDGAPLPILAADAERLATWDRVLP